MFRMTPVYDLLLRGSPTLPVGLYHLQMATAAQLCRLHYSAGSIKMVKARLKTLVDNGYAQADGIPTKFFRSPYYYTLGTKGMRYLEETGTHTNESFRASREGNKHALFVEHTLELNDVLVSAALLQRTDQRYCLSSFLHERVLKRHPYKATWTTNPGGRQNHTVIPDAFLDFRVVLSDGRQRRMPILLEHDRGTEGQYYFRRRIRAYIAFLHAEAYKTLLGTRSITIVFTTFAGANRLRQMVEWTRQELGVTNEPLPVGHVFLFATFDRPLDSRHIWLERCWHTPYTEDPPVAILSE